MQQKDYYDILGISPTANVNEIRNAYKAMSLQFHPDKVEAKDRGNAAEAFKKIANAYKVLSDEKTRRVYDSKKAIRGELNPDFRPEFVIASKSKPLSDIEKAIWQQNTTLVL